MSRTVVFDVVGTCVGYDAFFSAIDDRLGDRLVTQGIKAKVLGFAWIEAAEREYTYLSISGRYATFMEVFTVIFYRMLYMAGIESPREFASDEDRAYIMDKFNKLQMRPGLKECFEKLRAKGFKVKALTAGDQKRVAGYFEDAGIEMGDEDVVSCDEFGVAKPDLGAYTPVLEKLGKSESTWFAAAHMWDVSAATKSGFRGAYCSVLEKESCTELFGEMDVMSDTLEGLADGIIAASPA